MIETQSVAELVEKQIRSVVEQQVTDAMAEQKWFDKIETKVVEHIQDSITTKFSSIATIPELVEKQIKVVEQHITNAITEQNWLDDIETKVVKHAQNHVISKVNSIDTLPSLVEKQIRLIVDQQVADAITEQKWIDKIETKVVEHIQDRITAKFSSINTVPDLVATVKDSVVTLFSQGIVPDIATYVNNNVITQSVDTAVKTFISGVVEQLTQDVTWIDKIEKSVTYQMANRLIERLSILDLDKLIVTEVDRSIDKWQDRLKKNFKTAGIVDKGTKTELTILDDAVVVENQLISSNLLVDNDAVVNGTITLNNLIVKGVINTDNKSWDEIADRITKQTTAQLTDRWRQALVNEVLALAKSGGIDFASVNINGIPLVSDNTLHHSITNTSITQLGIVDKLTVAGHVELNETVTVNRGRLGINTKDPEMALSVWDEEVSVVAGKLSKQKAYVGTSRLQSMALGVNRVPQIELDVDGLTTIKQLRIDRFRISHGTEVPGATGTRGDFVFNVDPKSNAPFAWVCLGGFKWQPLRAS